MTTGFEQIVQDSLLQKHWLARLIAALIDLALVLIPVYILMVLLSWTQGQSWLLGAVIMGFVWFIYSSFFELNSGSTIGKKLLGLRVVPIQGRLDLYQAMMRNLTKVFGGFLIIDMLIGFLIDAKDPKQRYTDTLAKTTVITERNVLF